ncbi:MAG: polysaccharide deacetylase family protein [Lachnospirales bacterium]
MRNKIFLTILIIILFPIKVFADIPILLYHNVRENFNESGPMAYMYVKPETFKNQIITLKEDGYNFITITDYYNYEQGTFTMPEKPIMITFDDGYLDNYVNAYPILKELKVSATLFVSGRNINLSHGEFTEEKCQYMSWKELKEINDSGVFDVQSHSFDHTSFLDLSYEDKIMNSTTSFDLIKKYLDKDPLGIAVPYGFSNKDINNLLKENYKYILRVYRDNDEKEKNVFYRKIISEKQKGIELINEVNK